MVWNPSCPGPSRSAITPIGRNSASAFSRFSALAGSGRDARIQSNGVAGLDTLRDACIEMDVRMIACEAGLRAEAIDPALLLAGVEVAGIATFLAAAGPGQIVTL